MWYNNERDNKSQYYADSPDLFTWTERGKAVGDQAGEGPVVFRWQGSYWLIVDVWDGFAVYRSDDTLQWTRQTDNLLAEAGTGTDDQVKGSHADVVVSGERAFLFYFTLVSRTSAIQVVELHLENGILTCDRNRPTRLTLQAPTDRYNHLK